MREIKFRAIHKLTKKKWYEEDLIFHNGEWYEDWRAFEDGRPLNMEQCAVIQYTGMKDKNGVEIYEGDISAVTRASHVGIGGFGRMFYEERTTKKVIEFSQEKAYGLDFQYSDYEVIIEVIGNIYENPELLEDSVE